ncbi:MAG: cytochrome c1 [Gammaproteobacteria bacterium]|nr:cytochrome c1 [Gammaproteobacteria bacterium]MDX2488822.1 cytochrome c1 [Gammaproteobacteria bacterium]
MKKLFLLLTLVSMPVFASGGGGMHLDDVDIDMNDTASLQRGAGLFVNYCLSCHSAAFMRYNRMSEDLQIPEEVVENNMMFTADRIGGLMKTAMPAEDAKTWFGKAPPDLSLIARSRGPEWIYTYMRSFYLDDSSPSGWNNVLFEKVAMPHVLYNLQGARHAIFKKDEHGVEVFDHYEMVKPGSLNEDEFDASVRDLTNFMVYLAEPARMVRYKLGVYVLIFLSIFFVFAYLLKKEYFKDLH